MNHRGCPLSECVAYWPNTSRNIARSDPAGRRDRRGNADACSYSSTQQIPLAGSDASGGRGFQSLNP